MTTFKYGDDVFLNVECTVKLVTSGKDGSFDGLEALILLLILEVFSNFLDRYGLNVYFS